MHEKKQISGYYHCASSINACPTIPEDHKNKEQPGDAPKQNILGVHLKGSMCDNTRKKPRDDYLAVQRDYKVAGNLDGDASTSEENGMTKIDTKTRAKRQTFSADRELCSKSVPELLPALKAKD
ncbi:Hypothetical predicted protein [Podarcis lilfordi]|uniref:Uncharacterized protein n=1 Tax=Podarcis lilfordi TaxID=74358 RepID=A0AA35KLX9_9SAUR|nr:Hypothetical predicted protein [Podarcis lilfordi]